MDGITFLAEETFTYIPKWFIFTLFMIGIISFIIVYIGSKDCSLEEHPIVAIILFFVFIISLIMALIFGTINREQTQYKVTIDDTVTFKEFSEKYKVVSQEGEIYTIVEIEEGK